MKVIEKIASALCARANCEASDNQEWFARHTETLERIEREYLPSGSGVDAGTRIDLERSTGKRIVLTFGFHHMNEGGYYDGWTDHKVTVTPAFIGGFDLRVTGRDRNQIKDYLGDLIHEILASEYSEPASKEATEGGQPCSE